MYVLVYLDIKLMQTAGGLLRNEIDVFDTTKQSEQVVVTYLLKEL